ncbi:MAG: tRNA (guanosine(46)-N7)-methyltransferase TrmB [Campylobacter sp.]|nr:tRNA (guanosine(46)-N7)-methyltransferase TrmB [Campylobacter sp.]
MPNFKAKKLKKLDLPFEKDGVKLLWKAQNEKTILILVLIEEQKFFLQIKKEQDEFIIKADKHSKPSKISYLQKSLEVFKENFCEEVFSESFKNKALPQKTTCIVNDFDELLVRLKNKKIFIEIGFGSGRHLLFQAKQNPEILMLGIEIYTPSLTQVAKLAKNYDNILLIQSDARLLMSVLSPNCVEKIFLHFPVPWEKKPHRRVVSEAFCKECARVLTKDGVFELRTDSFEYFDFTLKNFLEFQNPKFCIKKNENLEISSKYEDRWKRQNKNLYDLSVWNLNNLEEELSLEEPKLETLSFTKQSLINLQKKFNNQTFKEKDFFLHFQNFYKLDENALLLKISLGAFNKPEIAYLSLGQNLEFVFKKPFRTRENLKALKKLEQILYDKNLEFS